MQRQVDQYKQICADLEAKEEQGKRLVAEIKALKEEREALAAWLLERTCDKYTPKMEEPEEVYRDNVSFAHGAVTTTFQEIIETTARMQGTLFQSTEQVRIAYVNPMQEDDSWKHAMLEAYQGGEEEREAERQKIREEERQRREADRREAERESREEVYQMWLDDYGEKIAACRYRYNFEMWRDEDDREQYAQAFFDKYGYWAEDEDNPYPDEDEDEDEDD
jgi:hypothetical protein